MVETAQLLTLLRQHEPPRPPAFTGIIEDDKLVLDKVEYLRAGGLAELKGCILSSRALMTSGRPTFHDFTDVNENGAETTNETGLSHLCIMLGDIASRTEICLVHLGTVSGLELRGLREGYLILTEISASRIKITHPVFVRVGLVISGKGSRSQRL